MITSASGNIFVTHAELQSELMAGESLLWAGQPDRKVLFHRSDWFAIPFSLMWGGFAIFWEGGVLGYFSFSKPDHAPLFMVLWGIPFVLMGQYLIWGRFFYTAWKKTRTYYGITNRRVIVLITGPSRKIIDGYLNRLDSVTLTTRADGIGTIEFSPEPKKSYWGDSRRRNNFPMDIDLSRLVFFDIPDAKTIYQLIQSERERILAINQ